MEKDKKTSCIYPIKGGKAQICAFVFIFFPGHLYRLARATITQFHRLGSLHNQNLLSHTYGNCRSMIEVLEDWFLQRPLSLACRSHLLAVPSLLWACSPRVSSSSHKDISPIGLESHPDNLM